ncbi:hypothetical protein QNI16_00795 [Cytophagaceae bacterium YF14B1]|uniref:Uncharacterized protein n=1 Tax=Xanthocytophaga flava TaxID=3048013 RepID=A0AAE3U494_9BACT|nr:hypothetical protein [Xanthocytophaga flavus]MDJ1478996.1 hypothetical protein [Xanthocytophaga flavus]
MLGLGQLLSMPDNETEEEELYLNKIIEVTGKLDQIVKEMNDILTNELPDNLKD